MNETLPAREAERPPGSARKRLSLASWILIAMAAGIGVGIFFGEYVAFLDVVGNGFIKLLQMTILPYILVSLIVGIGGLSYDKARIMAVKAGILLLITWFIAFFFIMALPLAFPTWESASFYSSSLIHQPKQVDFLSIYIPANPFHSLANNFVPAVVIFSITFGIALIGIERRTPLMSVLEVTSQTLMRVSSFVVRLTPIGVFAIAASAAGTMSVEELAKLQVYIILFTLACLLLTFWVLPAMISAATPFKYEDVVGLSRDALLTAFTTGNLFVVLPILTENAKHLFRKYDMVDKDTDAYVDVLIPTSFNFPNIGKLIMLFFIPFAGWFSGNEIPLEQYPQFIASGLLSFFGGVDVALPFMLDQMQVPSDMYELYMMTGIVNGRTSTLLAAMNLLVFTLLATASLTGFLNINWTKVGLAIVTSLALLILLLAGSSYYFQNMVENAYNKDEILATMHLLESGSPKVVHSEIREYPPDPDPNKPLMERIMARGVLRVGYVPHSLPFAFINENAELVGFDIEMAHLLANELGLKLEIMPIEYASVPEQLDRNTVDIVMSGIPATTGQLAKMLFSESYMQVSRAIVTRDYRRKQFEDVESIRGAGPLTVAILESKVDDYFIQDVEKEFPNVTLFEIRQPEEFFDDDENHFDAMIMNAESGSAWSLLYPNYEVVVPRPDTARLPLAYPIAQHDTSFAVFISQWIAFKRENASYRSFYDHWILGLTAEEKPPRWSIIRDVLHWVE